MPEIKWLEQRTWTSPPPRAQTSLKMRQPELNKSLPHMPYSVLEMNRSQERKLTRQEPNPILVTTNIMSSATQWLVQYLPTWTSGHAPWKGTTGGGKFGILLPPADSPSRCWSTSTCEVFPTSSAAHRVGITGRGFAALPTATNRGYWVD